MQVAAIYVVVSFTTLYEYAKGNSGPLKPGVQTVEGTVKTVIGPVYDKFRNVPLELLTFVDRKVRFNAPYVFCIYRIVFNYKLIRVLNYGSIIYLYVFLVKFVLVFIESFACE